MAYLDKSGLSYLWGKIKSALSTKQSALRPDASLHLTAEGEISVTLPVVALSASEYAGLTEEERQAEALYAVEEPAWTPLPQGLSIQEYDTEDGWHVRKWSNGYVEMVLNETYTVNASSWVATTAHNVLSTVLKLFKAKPYPVKLTEIFSETPVCFADDWTLWASIETNEKRLEQTQTARPVAIGKPNISLEIHYTTTVTGRWK